MLDLLKQFANKIEAIKGRKLLMLLIVLFVVFTIIGISIGYFTSGGLNKDEITQSNDIGNEVTQIEKTYLEGKIVYVNPEFYPEDNVSYKLVDSAGKEIVLLKAKDQKLSIAENLNVKVAGKVGKLKDGKTDVMVVEEIIINNAANWI